MDYPGPLETGSEPSIIRLLERLVETLDSSGLVERKEEEGDQAITINSRRSQ
jgi:hypothetical protein